jgi:hypothetical protein
MPLCLASTVCCRLVAPRDGAGLVRLADLPPHYALGIAGMTAKKHA